MKNEITFIVEPDAGKVTVEVSGLQIHGITELEKDCGKATRVNCGKPSTLNSARENRRTDKEGKGNLSIWLYRLYHNSVVDGPGRRSVVQVAGCSIRCLGCYVPETHDRQKRDSHFNLICHG